MPAPIPNEIRREIIEQHLKGKTLTAISTELQLSYNTVKKIWGHWCKYQKLAPNYEQAHQKGTRQYQNIYEAALETKRQHPRWGGQLILWDLASTYPEAALPSVRSLQRWFREAGLNRAPKQRQERVKTVKRGQSAHEIWAVDAKEQMQLADGSYACWLTVTDEASGCILGSQVFPPALLDTGG